MGAKTCVTTQARTKSDAADPVHSLREMALKTKELSGSGASAKFNDKHHCVRRRGMEKSVLDDIMEDADDIKDLAESDAESEGGRWEDAVRQAEEESRFLQRESLIVITQPERKDVKVMDSNDKVLRKKLKIGSALSDKVSIRTVNIEEAERSTQISFSGQQCLNVKEKNKHTWKALENGLSGPSKLHQTRYFVIKSLNHHNISKSIEKGIWATQAMNEAILNEAFETSRRVLLIFSVNMSGHFQGYAQMVSAIGRRKTDVWNESSSGSNPWGGSFNVQWLRLYDLPFQKTVHLKNPLNSFKPVKISRDCQELPEDIGQALCDLIDEGANKEGRLKRRAGMTDSIALKRRLHGEVAASSFGVFGSTFFPVQTRNVLTAPVYSSSPNTYSEQAQSSMPRSPRCLPPQTDTDLERGCPEGKSRSSRREEQRASHTIDSTDLPPEEDLLNMTYEEYLQRHGKSREHNSYNQTTNGLSPYQSTPSYGPGWMTVPSVGYFDDQYSSYLTKWYNNQQGSMLFGDCYFTSGTATNPFSGIHPPHC